MEENAGTVSDGVAEAPFSELVSRWLDEGDRLDENVAAAATGASARVDRPLPRIVSWIREGVARYRLFVLAGVGLLLLPLLMATQRVAPAPAIAASMVAVVPVAASPAPSPARAIPGPPVPSVEPSIHRPVKHLRRHHHLVLRRSR